MKKQLLVLTLAASFAACSRNPDPEYSPDHDPDAAAEVVVAAPAAPEAPAAVAAAPVARMSDAEAMRLGREVATSLFARDVAAIWPRFDADMKTGLQSEESFTQSVGRMFGQIGEEVEVLSETIETRDDAPEMTVYVRRSNFMNAGEGILSIAFHPDGTIGGMRIRPAE